MALWLMLLGTACSRRAPEWSWRPRSASAVSATLTWALRTISTRVQRRFRDRVTIALEAHVARLQASVATIAHHERPDYLDRLVRAAAIRCSCSTTCTCRCSRPAAGFCDSPSHSLLLVSIHPALALIALARCPRCSPRRGGRPSNASPTSPAHRPRASRVICSSSPPRRRRRRRSGSPASARASHRSPRVLGALVPAGCCHAPDLGLLARAGVGRVRCGVRRRRRVRGRRGWPLPPGRCCWCWRPAAASRPTSARRWARSDSCAASGWMARGGSRGSRTTRRRSGPRPTSRRRRRSRDGIRFDHVSFAYPGSDRLVLRRRVADVAGRCRGRGRRRERRRQDDAGQAAGENVRAGVAARFSWTTCRWREWPPTNGDRGWPVHFRISTASSCWHGSAWAWVTCRAWTIGPPWSRP